MVDEAWRNRGIGTALMRAAIDWARLAADVEAIRLIFSLNNRPMHKLVRKLDGRLDIRLDEIRADIIKAAPQLLRRDDTVSAWQGWLPWLVVSAVVIAWTTFKVASNGQMDIQWPGLHNAVTRTLYVASLGESKARYAAVWQLQPLATGTAILVATVITSMFVGVGVEGFLKAAAITWRQSRVAILTAALIVGLAYLMNYSGMNYTLGLGVASAGALFPLLSAFLGSVAVFLSGSDTSGNALFGNLQVVAANQLHLNPILIAATNSSGGVMGKMISPQNIVTGISVTNLKGQEGAVFARTLIHSIVLTILLGLMVLLQQYVVPGMIPG